MSAAACSPPKKLGGIDPRISARWMPPPMGAPDE
jgi:hypothetical protein